MFSLNSSQVLRFIFIIWLSLGSLVHAALSPEIETLLDQALTHYHLPQELVASRDETQVVQAFAKFLRTKVSQFSNTDPRQWTKVLMHLSSQSLHQEISPLPCTRMGGESRNEFEVRKQTQTAKARSEELLRTSLIQYLLRFYRNTSLPAVQVRDRALAVLEAPPAEAEPNLSAPRILAHQLFSELLGNDTYEGWTLHLQPLLVFRGVADPRHESSRDRIMVALTHPGIGQIPLFQVNQAPVALTEAQDSQSFFASLASEIRSQKDGTWVGYRYIFYPDALIDTFPYSSPESREPISIYLMKKVSRSIGAQFSLKSGELQKFEADIEELKTVYDLFQEGEGLTLRDQRSLYQFLADHRGLPRAQYELAKILKHRATGLTDLESANYYAILAHSQGLPMLKILREWETDYVNFDLQNSAPERVRSLLDLASRLKSSVHPRKVERARTLYRELADRLNVPEAHFEMAQMCKEGLGGKKDLQKAAEYAVLAYSHNLPLLEGLTHFLEDDRSKAGSDLSALPRTHRDGGLLPAPAGMIGNFVKIPAGILPGGARVAEFEAAQFPVTRGFYLKIVNRVPTQARLESNPRWEDCPNCPATDVSVDDEIALFLHQLNERESHSGCDYDLPTNDQLWYMVRADETGTNQDIFSTGVNVENYREYVIGAPNSSRARPVGSLRLNRFGIELGNVWKISKTPAYHIDPDFRIARGGSWQSYAVSLASDARKVVFASNKYEDVGFILVRNCR